MPLLKSKLMLAGKYVKNKKLLYINVLFLYKFPIHLYIFICLYGLYMPISNIYLIIYLVKF